jgi:acetyl-CoA carboxylase carboxyltransferase component
VGLEDLVDELAARRTRVRAMGGAEAVDRQHAAGKLTVRERLELLFDAGTFLEIGAHAAHAGISPEMAGRETPAELRDAFNVPLVFLQDVPGFMVGSRVERAGIIRHGAKMHYAVSEATVPKLTVVLRKAYGAGDFVMCGRAYEPDLIVAWPTAEISVMGPEGGSNIIFRREIAAASRPDEERGRRVEEFRTLINPYSAAGAALIDDVIDPRETRPVLIRALQMAGTKRIDRPWRKHRVMPV